jgi:hypothetical protein
MVHYRVQNSPLLVVIILNQINSVHALSIGLIHFNIMAYSYNKNQRDALYLKFIFGIELYMFRTGLLFIIRSLVPYTQQKVFVKQVMLAVC